MMDWQWHTYSDANTHEQLNSYLVLGCHVFQLGTLGDDELVATFVDNQRANLTLVPLFSETPGQKTSYACICDFNQENGHLNELSIPRQVARTR